MVLRFRALVGGELYVGKQGAMGNKLGASIAGIFMRIAIATYVCFANAKRTHTCSFFSTNQSRKQSKQAGKQISEQTGRRVSKQACKQGSKQTWNQASKQASKLASKQLNNQANKQVN